MSEKFEISRVFEASRQRVWDAWSKPEQLGRWLGPAGAISEVKHFEFKPGGFLHSKQTGPDGSISWGKNIYREIDPLNRLVWEQAFSNEAGDIVPAPFPMPWPLKMLTTVVFDDAAGGTNVSLTWEPIDPTPEQQAAFIQMLPSLRGGWTDSFEQLDALLAGQD